MAFLLVSQRALASPQYNLKDLTGHGRIDVVMRCILAATRTLASDQGSKIYCLLKGSQPHGWLTIDPEMINEDDDEISLAAKLQTVWQECFTVGELEDLLALLPAPFILLSEDGDRVTKFDGTIILGAQNDLTEEDLAKIPVSSIISLGSRSLLASHAIIYTRQLLLYK